METWYFDIPIYRSSMDQHTAEMNRAREAYTAGAAGHQATYQNANTFWWTERWRCWEFNEVVGWLRLFMFGGNQLRGELYLHEGRAVVAGHRKFKWMGKAFEVSVPDEAEDREILALLREAFASTMRERGLRRRFLDVLRFDAIAPFVSWRKLLQSSDIVPSPESPGSGRPST